jgi:hypothetical protein
VAVVEFANLVMIVEHQWMDVEVGQDLFMLVVETVELVVDVEDLDLFMLGLNVDLELQETMQKQVIIQVQAKQDVPEEIVGLMGH